MPWFARGGTNLKKWAVDCVTNVDVHTIFIEVGFWLTRQVTWQLSWTRKWAKVGVRYVVVTAKVGASSETIYIARNGKSLQLLIRFEASESYVHNLESCYLRYFKVF
jgi:hypothetical protein